MTGDGGTGYQNSGDRTGIMCKTVDDAVKVLDATRGFGDTRDIFTALPKGLFVPKEPYSSFVVHDADVKNKPLKGMRIAVVREFMVKHVKNDETISDQADKEIKSVLRDKLGADLVESVDPLSGRSGDSEHEIHIPAGLRRNPAACHAGILLPDPAVR